MGEGQAQRVQGHGRGMARCNGHSVDGPPGIDTGHSSGIYRIYRQILNGEIIMIYYDFDIELEEHLISALHFEIVYGNEFFVRYDYICIHDYFRNMWS